MVVGLNEPQAPEPHVAVQITPPLRGSFVVRADSPVGVLISSEVGSPVVTIETAMGVESTVRLTVLDCEGLLVTVAVIVTVVPIGITDGAVNRLVAPSLVCAGESVPHAPLVILR